MKRLFCLLLSVVMVLSFAACGVLDRLNGSRADPADLGITTQVTSTDQVTIRFAYSADEEHPTHKATVEKFKDVLEGVTGGNITVELYPNAQLGSQAENLEALRRGDLEMAYLNDSTICAVVPEYYIVGLPYLWTSIDAAHKALDGEFGQYLSKKLKEEVGIRNLAWGDVGFRCITNSRKTIASPTDLKGLKICTLTNPLHVEYFEVCGVVTSPMSFAELYTALQYKTIDGQENPISIIYSNELYKQQNYMTVSEHVFTGINMGIADSFYSSLPADYQALIAEAAANTMAYQRELINAENQAHLAEIEAAGVEVTVLNADQKSSFRKIAEYTVFKTAAESYGKDLVDMAAAHNH